MKLAYHEFLRNPDAAVAAGCLYVHGTDLLMKDDVVARLRAAHEDVEVTTLDGTSLTLDQVLVPVQTAGLFAARKPSSGLSGAKPSRRKGRSSQTS